MDTWDVAVVGGGILGTSLGYWLAARYDGRIAVIEREKEVAEHTRRRKTGVVHRPFFLHPVKRRVFARAAQVSYGLWKRYAAEKGLPFDEVGTYEVAFDEPGMDHLETYTTWAVQNGMRYDEVELLDAQEMRGREPNVSCSGALLSKTDTVVDYQAFTQALRRDAESLGAKFLMGSAVREVHAFGDDLTVVLDGGRGTFRARFVVNCAGGGAVDLAHRAGVALEYTDLHFRGEYWVVDGSVAGLVRRNVYSVPRHTDMPFLDPHWVVRANGGREIGPNAVPVTGPWRYQELATPLGLRIEKLLEAPVENKISLLRNPEFVSLSMGEMMRSISKGEMLESVPR